MLTLRVLPDPVLRQRAIPVDRFNSRHASIIREMIRIMIQHGGVGLAANQVGILERIIVVQNGKVPIGLVNPVIVRAEGSSIREEGCLSIPGMSGKVERAEKIEVLAIDDTGKKVRFTASGLLARVIQHEIDHLDGVLFIDKMIWSEG